MKTRTGRKAIWEYAHNQYTGKPRFYIKPTGSTTYDARHVQTAGESPVEIDLAQIVADHGGARIVWISQFNLSNIPPVLAFDCAPDVYETISDAIHRIHSDHNVGLLVAFVNW